jgi:hypothetical protein
VRWRPAASTLAPPTAPSLAKRETVDVYARPGFTPVGAFTPERTPPHPGAFHRFRPFRSTPRQDRVQAPPHKGDLPLPPLRSRRSWPPLAPSPTSTAPVSPSAHAPPRNRLFRRAGTATPATSCPPAPSPSRPTPPSSPARAALNPTSSPPSATADCPSAPIHASSAPKPSSPPASPKPSATACSCPWNTRSPRPCTPTNAP